MRHLKRRAHLLSSQTTVTHCKQPHSYMVIFLFWWHNLCNRICWYDIIRQMDMFIMCTKPQPMEVVIIVLKDREAREKTAFVIHQVRMVPPIRDFIINLFSIMKWVCLPFPHLDVCFHSKQKITKQLLVKIGPPKLRNTERWSPWAWAENSAALSLVPSTASTGRVTM